MYLEQRPWYFRNGDNIFKVSFTSEARDMFELGYERVNADGSPYGVKQKKSEDVVEAVDTAESGFEAFTRAELVKYCSDNNISVKSNASKAELLKACEDSING